MNISRNKAKELTQDSAVSTAILPVRLFNWHIRVETAKHYKQTCS